MVGLKAKPWVVRPNWDAPPIFFLDVMGVDNAHVLSRLRRGYGAGNAVRLTGAGGAERVTADLVVGTLDGLTPAHRHGLHDFAWVTQLCHPWMRLCRHINLLRAAAVAIPPNMPAAQRAFLDRLALVDFNDIGALRALRDDPDAKGRGLKNHFSTVFTVPGAPITGQASLANFWHISLTPNDPHVLLSAVGIHTVNRRKLAPQPPEFLRPDNVLARDVLSPWYNLDQVVWGYAHAVSDAKKDRAESAAFGHFDRLAS